MKKKNNFHFVVATVLAVQKLNVSPNPLDRYTLYLGTDMYLSPTSIVVASLMLYRDATHRAQMRILCICRACDRFIETIQLETVVSPRGKCFKSIAWYCMMLLYTDN